MGNTSNSFLPDKLDKVPTNILVDALSNGADQDTINKCAYELTRRIWVPNKKISFEQMLTNFGFRYPEEEQVKVKKL